jgi:hypothetical protein
MIDLFAGALCFSFCSHHLFSCPDDLADALKDYLCSPASRMDNPDPVQFLEDVKNPRFTGESGKNLTTATLQRIMSGEILKNLGVSVCFMLRFALATPEDHSLEKKPIDYTKMLPSLTEKEMKSMDVSDELPGLVLPQIDQDVDQDGSQILRFKKVMGVFTELPFEDKIFYFDTKAEYLAFCRFELVRVRAIRCSLFRMHSPTLISSLCFLSKRK